MLKEFIKEYKAKFEISFDSGFLGEWQRFRVLLTEPKFHPSKQLLARLNLLNSLNHEPPLIAVVGQFSSGKSSFLNALLGREILPTGVVPVTAKPTFIKYAPNFMLKALYDDGSEEYKDINELASFVDQRLSLKGVKSLHIYAPNELLKKASFIDTPGLNSRSDADTNETKKILKDATALIWISLIDNAARSSELEELSLVPRSLKLNSICLLNQKDKFTQSEIQNVLNHANITYKDYFNGIFAVSSKLEIKGSKDSGFENIFKFIDRLNDTKQEFIKAKCEELRDSSIAQNAKFINILSELETVFDEFCLSSNAKFEELKSAYGDKFKLMFEEVKQNSYFIANEINKSLISQKREYFKEKTTVFGKKIYEKVEYERVILNSDEVLSKLIYNDDKMSKIFRKFKKELGEFETVIKSDLEAIFETLKDRVLGFKAKYESLRKSDEFHSDVLFADIRKFSSEVYARFLNEFEKTLFKSYAKLGLFFEKISIKIATNYENAIKLAVFFIEQKCLKASSDYESDPLAFSLYYPKLDEINERVLGSLGYYEFENEFIGNRAFIIKFIDEISSCFACIKEENLKHINDVKDIYLKNIDELKSDLIK
ncbi:dynamin family protein [Campylobacter hyointestinalis]|uniref:dynamin family protein n=1 Tax=Campylobacter hyointestinalis TaxID=198 RepID=UPI001BD38514|nr:dynamin family protein [Campylobacter hyointestinalis subsp. hyointestinalis]MDY2998549.1 dynamin family protein [Campylobacter hyointestinalis]